MGKLEEVALIACSEILLEENKKLKVENKYLRSELDLFSRFLRVSKNNKLYILEHSIGVC